MIADLQKQLGIDSSFFLQLVIFIFVYLWLRYVFFKPYLNVVLARENQTEGMKDESVKLDTDSQSKEEEYAAKIAAARKQAASEREKILVEARADANKITERARKEAKEKIDASRAASQQQAKKDFDSLKDQAGALAALFVEKLTKSKVGL